MRKSLLICRAGQNIQTCESKIDGDYFVNAHYQIYPKHSNNREFNRGILKFLKFLGHAKTHADS